MSTLSFQDYVRERMLRRRRAEQQEQQQAQAEAAEAEARAVELQARPVPPAAGLLRVRAQSAQAEAPPPVLREALPESAPAAAAVEMHEVLSELRAMKGLIEDRFGALAFMEKLQRS
jgi:flagellar biosynthesis protein FlhF